MAQSKKIKMIFNSSQTKLHIRDNDLKTQDHHARNKKIGANIKPLNNKILTFALKLF